MNDEARQVELSTQEQQLLRYVPIVKALKELLSDTKEVSKPKPRWQIFIESTGGAALITVIVGGLIAGAVGQWITNEYQKGMKEREAQAAAYKEYLGQGKETVTRSYEVVGSVISASDDLIALTDPRYSVSSAMDATSKSRLLEYRQATVTRYNTAANQWRQEREKLGLFIIYYHDANPQVMTSWRKMQDSVTGYMSCAEECYFRFVDQDFTKPCEGTKEELYDSLKQFTIARISAASQAKGRN